VLYAWENPGVSVDEVVNDVLRSFHHPAIRDEHVEIQRNMFNTVKKWIDENPDRNNINSTLNSNSVKAGRNHKADPGQVDTTHNLFRGLGEQEGAAWNKIQTRDLGAMSDSLSRPGSPISRGRTPDFGYQNVPFDAPQSQGGNFLQPDISGGYGGGNSQAPPPMNYETGPGSYQDPYQQGPPGGFYQGGPPQGGPGYPGGPPPQGPPFGGGYPGPGFSDQYGAPQQPYQQPPYGQPPYGQPPYGAPPNQYPGGYGGPGY
jgi:hypothetical protein